MDEELYERTKDWKIWPLDELWLMPDLEIMMSGKSYGLLDMDIFFDEKLSSLELRILLMMNTRCPSDFHSVVMLDFYDENEESKNIPAELQDHANIEKVLLGLKEKGYIRISIES